MADYQVIDADGHVRESIAGMREFLEPRWQRRNLFPNDAWDRDLRGKLGASPEGPEDQLAAMDQDGIDVMVLYPTAGLHVASLHEADFATALTRAYNDWLSHFCKTNPARLKFVALLAPQDPKAAAEELQRAVRSVARWRSPAYLHAAEPGLRRPALRSDLHRRRAFGRGARVSHRHLRRLIGRAALPKVSFGTHYRPSRRTNDGTDRDSYRRRVRALPIA